MKNIIFILILIITVISCKENNAKTSKFDNLKPGPIIHKSLNEEQLDKIKYIQETFNEVYPVSLEETITNFKRDQNPNNEINIWLNMAKSYKSFILTNSKKNIEYKKEVFKLILMRSMMPDEEAIKSSKIKLLSNKEVSEILKSYSLSAKPVKIVKE